MAGGLNKLSLAWRALLALPGQISRRLGVRRPSFPRLASFSVTQQVPAAGRALAVIRDQSRALIHYVPRPVQLHVARLSRGSATVGREAFAGLLVLSLVALGVGYGRLNQGPVSLAFLVPTIEEAIDREIAPLDVEIDDAVLLKDDDGSGVAFRLRNVRLLEADGSVVAQSPLAAVGLSGAALLSGRIAPGSVDFIGPQLLMSYDDKSGLALSFTRSAANGEALPPPRGVPKRKAPVTQGLTETVVAKQPLRRSAAPFRRLDVTRTLADALERLREGGGTSSYLTRFGVKNAAVVFDHDGKKTTLQVPDFAINLEHRNRRSIILGSASVASSNGPWKLSFRTEQLDRRQRLLLTGLVQDFVPTAFAADLPGFQALKAIDVPVTAETKLDLSNTGQLISAEARVRIAAGHVTVPWEREHPMLLDEGDLRIRYLREEKRVEILPSTLSWGGSELTVSGSFQPSESSPDGRPRWDFILNGDDSVLQADEFGLKRLAVDELRAEGQVEPQSGEVHIRRFLLRAGNASVDLAGTVIDAPGSPAVKLEGRISEMPGEILKQFWPKFLAAASREWVGKRISTGHVLGGTFKVDLGPGQFAAIDHGGDIQPDAFRMDLAAKDLTVEYIPRMPPLSLPEAKLEISGRSLIINAGAGHVALQSGQMLGVQEGSFSIPDLRPKKPLGEIAFKANGPTAAVLDLLDHEPFGYVRKVGFKPAEIGGATDGGFRLVMPMKKDLHFSDMKLRGLARVENITSGANLGPYPVEGGTLDVNFSEEAIETRGDVLLKGVNTQVHWQRIFGVPDDKQPDLRLSATLNETARARLGLDVNHMVKGDTPINLTIGQSAPGARTVRMQSDLTNARLLLSSMSWTKPAGKAATVQFDVVQKPEGDISLEGFRIAGDDIAVDGWILLDPKKKLKSFYFSDFSFNRQTHVELSGEARHDGVLDVKAMGPSYDGRELLRALFSAAPKEEDETKSLGMDLDARIGSVAGNYDTSLDDARIIVKKRRGELQALDVRGMLHGRSPVGVKLEGGAGRDRIIRAESADAGGAFRLLGLYAQIEGGEASLEMNLDRGGAGAKSGTLWARDFAVVGDGVVGQVLSDVNTDTEQASRARGPQRRGLAGGSRVQFSQLRAPFSIAGSQFTLQDAYINGPLLGATMRGQINFASRRIDVGGTYVPLYGLNSALGNIPIIGNLLVGREGEGVLGITFAIQGAMANPNVLVNPISMVAPGIFRQIFEFSGPVPESMSSNSGEAASSANTQGFPRF